MKRVFGHRPRRVLVIGNTAPIATDLPERMSELAALEFVFAGDGDAGLQLAVRAPLPFDAILVSMHADDDNGAAICAGLRDLGLNVPILLLAERASEREIVCGLNSGANDVLVAPLRLGETVARLRAQIRAYETSEDAVLWIGPFDFRPASRALHHRITSARVRLTEKEAAVLKFLYSAEDPVPRHTLLQKVWGYNAHATTHTVETHIYRLRRKIEPDPGQIVLLVNEDGGYRLKGGGHTPMPRFGRSGHSPMLCTA